VRFWRIGVAETMTRKTHDSDDLLGGIMPPDGGKRSRKAAKPGRQPRSSPAAYPSYATIAVNEPVPGLFDYGVPADNAFDLAPGAIVEVPFAGRVTRGCVVRVSDSPPQGLNPRRIKGIARRIATDYAVDANLVELGLWIADYYHASPGETLACVSFIGFNEARAHTVRHYRLASDWEQRAGLAAAGDDTTDGQMGGGKRRGLTAKQTAVVRCLGAADNQPTTPDDIAAGAGAGSAVLRGMADRGILEAVDVAQERGDDYGPAPQRDIPLQLNPAQQAALAELSRALDAREPTTFVLHGVTGSGKTEVYLQAIRKTLNDGGCAIVLVPEISLTPQAVDRFRSRFGGIVGVYHSKLTMGQKFDLWRRVRDGSCRIMVGARSAIFTPFPDLRIVVIDEEHEASYKQDSTPRYHARDVAIVRAQRDRAVVVLGSATPSVESYFKAQTGKFRLIALTERIDHLPLPPVQVVDLTREAKENLGAGIFSEALRGAMEQALARGEQVLLFINRRGFFNFAVCLDCNTVVRCDHCDVTMTHHKPRNILMCHYCNRTRPVPGKCPECGLEEINLVGLGTQRIEDAVRALFPEARVIRMDLDTTRQRNAYLDAWRRIESAQVDIILGTQMIAKGFHLEKVTVVGVPLADVSLFQPDFRSAERAFSMLTQVAGRAGRGQLPGRVVIQTYVPHHYAIVHAQTHDYRAFFDKEIRVRQVLRFPPHFRLISVLGIGRDAERTAHLFKEFGRLARSAAYARGSKVTILGPVPAPVARINDEHRWRLLIRAADHRAAREVLSRALTRYEEVPGRSACSLIVDVDPQDLM
jgi:primosomal protein N' (replication factor Y) (superfamily II helicase)